MVQTTVPEQMLSKACPYKNIIFLLIFHKKISLIKSNFSLIRMGFFTCLTLLCTGEFLCSNRPCCIKSWMQVDSISSRKVPDAILHALK